MYQLWLDEFNILDKEREIKYIADNFPDMKTLNIDFQEFKTNDLKDVILSSPQMCIRVGEAAIRSLLEPDQKSIINLRIMNLFQADQYMIKDFRSENLSKFIEMREVNVTWASDVRPKLLVAHFTCSSCGFRQEIEQDPLHYSEPLECPKDDGGCGKRAGSTTFRLLIENSLKIDSQKLELEDPHELTEGRDQPKRIICNLSDDLVGLVRVGDRISVTGVLKSKIVKEKGTRVTVLQTYFQGNHVTIRDKIDYDDISEEDLEQVEYIRTHNPMKLFKESLAPNIYGYDHIKTFMGLQFSGGVRRILPDGSYQRGDIHGLLVGDPSTAKSQLAKAASRKHPRSIYTSGKGSSAAGITAAVVKRSDIEGRWGIEAGTMVLADQGLHITDEMDKMAKEDASAMNDALEIQQVVIAKAGLHGTLPSRCANLGCANPKLGRYKPGIPASAQIDMDPSLLSRHLVFVIMDTPNKDTDEKIAERILLNRWGNDEDITPPIPDRIWHIYWYMIQPINPKGAIDKVKKIIKEYVNIRQEGLVHEAEHGGQATLNITARQLEDISRLAEASARLRMDEVVDANDVKLAIEIAQKSSQDLTGVKEGWGDQSAVYKVKSKTDKTEFMKDLIYEIQNNVENLGAGAAKLDILDRMNAEGFEWDERTLEKYLKRALDEGMIIEKSVDYFVTI